MSASIEGIASAAKVGAEIGATAGLVPLVVGLLWRQIRQSLIGFALCVIAGAIGGLYAVIPVVVMSSFRTMGLTVPTTKANRSRIPTTAEEFGISLALVSMIIVCFGAAMILSAIYVTPWILGQANCVPKSSTGQAIEFTVLFGSMLSGMLFGLLSWKFLCRLLVSKEKREQLWRRSEARLENYPMKSRQLFGALNKIIFPLG